MKKTGYVLLLAFILIQFFQIDKTNPPVNKGVDFIQIKKTPQPVADLIKNSCYDCHSNETKYPWYSSLQPAGWFLKNHYEDGRKHLNFSEFATYEPKKQIHKLEEIGQEITSEEMPLESYTLIHKEAVLSSQDRQLLSSYFKKVKEDTQIDEATR